MMASNKVSINITLDKHGKFNVSVYGNGADCMAALALAAIDITSGMGVDNIAPLRKTLCDFIIAAPIKLDCTDEDIVDIVKRLEENRSDIDSKEHGVKNDGKN